MLRSTIFLLIILLIPVLVLAETITVTDATINAGETYTMYATNTYLLDGLVYVEDGATLNIEAGTVIKGKPGQGESASALIICQGAKIFANGTKDHPIIFTAEADDVNEPGDLPLPIRGQWGGLMVLGKAIVNTASGTGHIEGIPEEPRTLYGGDDDADNSGVIRYVSIRHGGTDIGSGNEINGLTMGGVGSGTTIEYVEVINNNDDGFEWFGGSVNCKYLVSAFNADDSFDYDEGYRGMGQFWLSIADPDESNRAGEHDGGTNPKDGTPYAQAKVYNATYIGGDSSDINADNDYALKIRDNAGAIYKNSIFMSFNYGVDIEDVAETEVDSRQRLDQGDIVLANNIWYNFGNGDTIEAISKHEYEAAHLAANNNVIADPLITVGYDRDQTFLPLPEAGSPAFDNLAEIPANAFYSQVAFKGAFGSVNWLRDWTAMDHYSYLSHDEVVAVEEDHDTPVAYTLGQNFPNPFNPDTTINFTVPEHSAVTLTVYDMLGQKVGTLVDQVMPSGTYSVSWDGSGHSSGIYFYSLKAGNSYVTKRMTLIK